MSETGGEGSQEGKVSSGPNIPFGGYGDEGNVQKLV